MADGEDTRDESVDEKLDRQWDDLIQELRVVQTGVQLLSGFLLTLPFTQTFPTIDTAQRYLYLALVLTAGLAVGITLTPIAVHRRLFGKHLKERLVTTGHIMTQCVIGAIAVLITGISTLIFSVVISWTAGLIVMACVAVVLVSLLVVTPILIAPSDAPDRE